MGAFTILGLVNVGITCYNWYTNGTKGYQKYITIGRRFCWPTTFTLGLAKLAAREFRKSVATSKIASNIHANVSDITSSILPLQMTFGDKVYKFLVRANDVKFISESK